MSRKRTRRSANYRADRARVLAELRRTREQLLTERSGAAIHHLELDLRYNRDLLALIRRNG